MSQPSPQSALPVLDQAPPAHAALPYLVHGLRLLLLVAILVVVRFANQKSYDSGYDLSTDPTAVAFVDSAFTTDKALKIEPAASRDQWNVSASAETIGSVIRTSPQSDDITGFSGPTDCLIGLDDQNKIVSVGILSSRDTVEHVDLIRKSPTFCAAFKGYGSGTSKSWADIDAVSGATLTSYAIVASVAKRISGQQPALKFRADPAIEKVRNLFPEADRLQAQGRPSMWKVKDAKGRVLGEVLSTSPSADDLVGYQGPTATLVGFGVGSEGEESTCMGLAVDQTYDNQPYASYLDDAYGFQKKYKGKTLAQLAEMDPETLGIEGVSGATMTTMCIAEGIPLATTAALRKIEPKLAGTQKLLVGATRDGWSYGADLVTIALAVMGVAFSFTKLSGIKWLRIGYQVAVVVLLGFYSGHMLSQASIAGWAANTIPWAVAPGLVLLSLAALAVPMFSKHQPYCQHICPFGAMQQWARTPAVKRIVPWKVTISKGVANVLRCVPAILLAIVVVTAVSGSRLNLAALEPFDGFGFRVAGWATIAVFVVGLLFSFVSPMAYCRFGCPTGALLNYSRFRANSHRLGLRDLVAAGLLVLAIVFLQR